MQAGSATQKTYASLFTQRIILACGKWWAGLQICLQQPSGCAYLQCSNPSATKVGVGCLTYQAMLSSPLQIAANINITIFIHSSVSLSIYIYIWTVINPFITCNNSVVSCSSPPPPCVGGASLHSLRCLYVCIYMYIYIYKQLALSQKLTLCTIEIVRAPDRWCPRGHYCS